MTQCSPTPFRAITAAIAMLLGMSACGGGGGGGDPAPVAPTVTTTTFSGTAATGAALANATVSITCAAGTGTTTTSATGAYAKDIASVTLPCALRAASADGTTVLYSVTTATATSSTTQVANITPLTQLVVANLTGGEPATFFNNFNATTAAAVTPAGVATAQTTVLNTLTQGGINTAGVTDLISGSLTAGSRTGYDGVLDAVQTQLAASGTTLATLTTTVAAASPAAATGTTVVDHTPRLPANLLLRDAASNCAALRSGDYLAINPQRGLTLAGQVTSVSLNAKTLTFTDNAVANGGGTLLPTGDCAYGIDSDIYVVSKGGVAVGTNTEAGKKGLSILVPRQTFSVADLAGSWNASGLDAGGDEPLESYGLTLSSTGVVSDLVVCDGAPPTAAGCVPVTAPLNLSSDAAGILTMTDSTPGNVSTSRLIPYRAGSGDLAVIELAGNGSIAIWAKRRTLSLPAVGEVSPNSRSVRINGDLAVTTADTADSPGDVVTSIDAAAQSITRTQTMVSGVSYPVTVTINAPRDGYNVRLPSTVQASDGAMLNIRGRTSLGLPGTGLSVQLFPQLHVLQMSVDR